MHSSHVHHRHIQKKRKKKTYIFIFLSAGMILFFFIFVFWSFTVVLPIAAVELGYQTNKAMMKVFGTNNITSLFIPTIHIVKNETSKYKDGSIVIPSIFLDEPVVYNVDPNDKQAYTQALKKGIAHASSTHLPDTGGLGYYFAHSSTPQLSRQYNAVFYLLGKLKTGDDIILWHNGEHYTYQVIETKITEPTDVSFLADTEQQDERVVLQTCWPPGTSEKRLLVFAKRVQDRAL